MLRLISWIYIKSLGWSIKGQFPHDLKKCIIIEAPHTSNQDFFLGRAAFYMLGIYKVFFLIKKESFKFPGGPILKALGGIPVDRKNNTVIRDLTNLFAKKKKLIVIITPEGTRKLSKNWKKGFYQIALSAKVPIVLAYMDYGKKEGGIGPIMYPSGNFDEDFKIIEDFYRDKTAKYPENFNLSPMYWEKKD